ncbi:MAG: hypothetical protein EOO24_53085 [Comamonadaceae bacterium]|nr:MAG: hypothetical protein EOO24_53085 [Comamonadaceae bacterium]
MLQFFRARLFAPRREPDPFEAYRVVVDALPRAAVPLAHALIHAVEGINDDLRRWLDVRLAERAPTALGQPASRAVVNVWHALRDGQATGLQVSAEADWTLIRSIGRDAAALEAMLFVLRTHVVTVQQWLPGAVDAARALASSMAPWPDAMETPYTAASGATPPR